MKSSKKHHYIPRSILKEFSKNGERTHIYQFDKRDNSIKCPSISDAGCENYFNTIRGTENGDINFESLFDENDSNIAPLVRAIINDCSKECLKDPSNMKKLLDYIVIQYCRVKIWRRTMQSLTKQTNKMIEREFEKFDVKKEPDISDEDSKIATILGLENKEQIFDVLFKKELVLLEAAPKMFFTTSDNPVSTLNRIPYSNNAIASLETEIYFPISPKLSLAFFSRGLLEMYKDKNSSFRINNFCKTFEAIEVSRKQVRAMNYAQILNSCNYLYSSTDDFDYEKYMLIRHPELKERESKVFLGEMGKGPIVSEDMPKGISLVIYGQLKSHIIPINIIQKDIRLQFTTEYIDELKRAIKDEPFTRGIVYSHNKTIKDMKIPYFSKSVLQGDDYFEMGYDSEGIDKLMIELIKKKDAPTNELNRLANKYLPK